MNDGKAYRFLRPLKVACWLPALVLTLNAHGQAARSPLQLRALQATFASATALAVDPQGGFFVADAGRDVVYRMDPQGIIMESLGGPGSAEGQFDDPMGLDASGGLILVVADAGNGRLQRFGRPFRFLASVPVGTASEQGGLPTSYRLQDAAPQAFANGRPVAVATSATGATYTIDAERGVVQHWDARGRPQRPIGQAEDGIGALTMPVDLAVDEASLYVADQEAAAVLVYDHFGTFIRTLAPGRADGVVGLAVHGEALYIALPKELLVYETRGRLLERISLPLDAPLVGLALTEEALYVLTATTLYEAPR